MPSGMISSPSSLAKASEEEKKEEAPSKSLPKAS